jgi:hypothetical protein
MANGLVARGEVGETIADSVPALSVVKKGLEPEACGWGEVVKDGTVKNKGGQLKDLVVHRNGWYQTYRPAIHFLH